MVIEQKENVPFFDKITGKPRVVVITFTTRDGTVNFDACWSDDQDVIASGERIALTVDEARGIAFRTIQAVLGTTFP